MIHLPIAHVILSSFYSNQNILFRKEKDRTQAFFRVALFVFESMGSIRRFPHSYNLMAFTRWSTYHLTTKRARGMNKSALEITQFFVTCASTSGMCTQKKSLFITKHSVRLMKFLSSALKFICCTTNFYLVFGVGFLTYLQHGHIIVTTYIPQLHVMAEAMYDIIHHFCTSIEHRFMHSQQCIYLLCLVICGGYLIVGVYAIHRKKLAEAS